MTWIVLLLIVVLMMCMGGCGRGLFSRKCGNKAVGEKEQP